MASGEPFDGPSQKKARLSYVSYPNFRPEGYEFNQEKEKKNGEEKKGPSYSVAAPVEHEASPVVHVRSLNSKVIEADLWNELGKYGKVINVFMIKQTGQALVEFEDINNAIELISQSKKGPITVNSQNAQFAFSKSKKIIVPSRQGLSPNGGVLEERQEHNVLLVTIGDVYYPINITVMHSICKPYGEVARIVIFRKSGVQAMVEYIKLEDAVKAKKKLNGAFIYTGCCSLRVDYAKPDKLTVKHNTQDSWDFTVDTDDTAPGTTSEPRVLLPNPYPAWDNPGPGSYGKEVEPWGGSGGHGGMPNWGPQQPPPPPPAPPGPPGMSGGYGDPNSHNSGSSEYGGYGSQSSGYGLLPSYPSGYGQQNYGNQSSGYGNQGNRSAATFNQTNLAGSTVPNSVIMCYGMQDDKMNCDRLFNLLCLYGNVVSIKFLKSKDDAAMVQMGDPAACQLVIEQLNDLSVFGNPLRVTHSKQMFLQEGNSAGVLKDGTPVYKDYKDNKCNRFLDSKTNPPKTYPPHTIIHYYNAPPGFNDDDMMNALLEAGAPAPDKVKVLGTKNGKNSSGLLQWVKQSDANDAMCLCNHQKLEEIPNMVMPGRRPNTYTLKFCFSNVPFIG